MDSKHPDADFEVNLTIHLDFEPTNRAAYKYSLAAKSSFEDEEQVKPGVPSPNSTVHFSIMAHKDQIELWWPNGMGAQPLYEVMVSIRKQAAVSMERNLEADDDTWISKRIGKPDTA